MGSRMDDMPAEAKYLNLVRYSRGWKAMAGDIVMCNLFIVAGKISVT